jgi:Cof subfamily protein (haloacid dehalogenase superfamily)
MSAIKLVLTDIDDTIAPHARHEVSDAVRQAIVAVEDKGIMIAAVSGRPFALAQPTLNVLGVTGLCISDGGATIVDVVTGENIWKQWLSARQVREILELVLPFSKLVIYKEGVDLVDAEAIDPVLIDADAPSIFAMIDESREAELKALLDTVPGIYTYFLNGMHPVTHEGSRALQITHEAATKQHGVEALRERLGIPIEYTLAIGDGDNDIALFRSASIKVAMGNATDQLKAEADHVVGTFDEDGFVEAMQRFVL